MDSAKEAIVSIGAGYEQLSLIRAARGLGYRVIAVDRNTDALGFALADRRIVLSTHETEPILKELHDIGDLRIKAVVTKTSGPSSIVTAEIASHLALPGVPPEMAVICADKSKFAHWCITEELPGIPSAFVGDEQEVPALRFPLILKPSLGRGGKEGVRIVREPHAFSDAARASLTLATDHKLIVQEYVEGQDLVVCSFMHAGVIKQSIVIDEKNVLLPHGPTTKGFSVPTALPEARVTEITELNERFLRATKIRDGLVWLSMRLGAEHMYLMEAHIDFAGDGLIDRLLPEAYQYDFLAEALRVYLGEEPESLRASAVHSYIYFLYRRDTLRDDFAARYNAELYPHVTPTTDWNKIGNIVLKGDAASLQAQVDRVSRELARPDVFFAT